MPKIKFDTKTLTALPHPTTGQVDYFDTMRPAFGLRVGKVRKTFFLMARIDRKQARLKIGTFGTGANDVSLKQARDIAGEYIAVIDEGGDPRLNRKASKEKNTTERHNTFGSVVERWLSEGGQKQRTKREIHHAIANDFLNDPAWRDRPISDLTGEALMQQIDTILERGAGYHANRVYSYLNGMFEWATKAPACKNRKAGGTKILNQNPLADYAKPFNGEKSRERVLTPDELRALVATLYGDPLSGEPAKVSWPFGPLSMLLILTGARRNEITGLRWSELDLENQVWRLPAERAKNGKNHALPLSNFAVKVIKTIPRLHRDSDFVFTTTGNTPVSGHSLAKRKIDAVSGVTGWRFHDLRRTMTTFLAALGVDMDTASALITHGKLSGGSATLAVYQRHKYEREMREATGLYSAFVSLILHGFSDRCAIDLINVLKLDDAEDAEPFADALGTLITQNPAWRDLLELLVTSKRTVAMVQHAILQVLHPVEVQQWATEMRGMINASRTLDKEAANRLIAAIAGAEIIEMRGVN